MMKVTEDNRTVVDAMRRVFNTVDGRMVFTWILKDLGTFDTIPATDPGAIATRNYGIRLLEMVGALSEATIYQLVDKIFELPVEVEKAKPEDEPDFTTQ